MTGFPCCIRPTHTTVTTLPSVAVQETREKRRKVLEAAANVRKENYRRYYAKLKAPYATTENSHRYQ
jgi:hypothetical protein